MMSEPGDMNPSPRRIELPGASGLGFAAASPQQLAQLQYLGVAVPEPLSEHEADRLINQANDDPAFAERTGTWETEKQALHPDLFRVPPRSARLFVPSVPDGSLNAPAAPAEPSPYAPIPSPTVPGFVPAQRAPAAIRPARSASPVKFLAAVAALAALGAAGWFLRDAPWMQQVLHKLSSVGVPGLPGSQPAAPGQPRPSRSSPRPPVCRRRSSTPAWRSPSGRRWRATPPWAPRPRRSTCVSSIATS